LGAIKPKGLNRIAINPRGINRIAIKLPDGGYYERT
jgi:hypothetical protein